MAEQPTSGEAPTSPTNSPRLLNKHDPTENQTSETKSETATASNKSPATDDAVPSTPATSAESSKPAPSNTPSTPSKPSTSSNKRKPPRCAFKECKERIQPIIGDCGFCKQKYCGKHRLLESHNCTGLEDCKDEARERNKDRLEGEKTVAVKGV